MSFKENLLRKIKLDRQRNKVLNSIAPSAAGVKVDRESMKYLLTEAGLTHTRLRNIDMFIDGSEGKETHHIFVLDNELAVYNTSINDVALRKEPTLKEMISIRNAMKILNDKDVIVSRKEQSVDAVYDRALSRLDLTVTADDINRLEYDGRAAVEWKDSESILESLSLFSELLDYQTEPKALKNDNIVVLGQKSLNNKGDDCFGPAVAYSRADDSIKMIKKQINLKDKESVNLFHEIVKGDREAFCDGPSVIKFLAGEVLKKHKLV